MYQASYCGAFSLAAGRYGDAQTESNSLTRALRSVHGDGFLGLDLVDPYSLQFSDLLTCRQR